MEWEAPLGERNEEDGGLLNDTFEQGFRVHP